MAGSYDSTVYIRSILLCQKISWEYYIPVQYIVTVAVKGSNYVTIIIIIILYIIYSYSMH